MKVCIAEKPSVAREIAQIVKATERKDGYFEGNGYQVTWTFGHFCTLFAPDDYFPHWKRWDLNTLPMLPEKFETRVMDDSGIQKQFKVIKSLFAKADEVINCGDAGQEGELIQRWVINAAKYTGPVKRLWISSLTKEAIETGFEKLMDAKDFDNLYYAGSSRAIGDWLLGMNATRLYTLKYGGYKQVLSVGRVQTPTLAMLVNRQKEIDYFVPSPYWELQTLYRDTVFNHTEGKFEKKEEGENLLEKVTGQPFKITSVSRKKGKEQPPRLFDLTSLQVHCNNKFAYSADQSLKLVQKLYEAKMVTYPRVDTTFLPNDMYPKIGGIMQKLTRYSALTAPLLEQKIRKPAKVFNDKKVTDHHAIIPTGVEGHAGPDEQNVYDAIVRQFLAAFYPDCLVANSVVVGVVTDVEFKATGKEILDEGWRTVFEKSKKDPADSILPPFTKGESGPHEPSFLEKLTKAPRFYTEATLLRAMETAGKQVDDDELRDLMKANGIGRPSTRAAIIETLFKRKYIRRNKKQILPTETGMALIDIIHNELLKSAELTGQWEKKLQEIESGDYNAGGFIKNMKLMVDSLVTEVRMENSNRRISAVKPAAANAEAPAKKAPKKLVGMVCPKCKNGQLLKGKSGYGCSQYKAGCDLRLPFKFKGKTISENQYKRLVEKGETVNLKGFKTDGGTIDAKVAFTETHQLYLKTAAKKALEKADALVCPKCKKGEVIKGKTAFGCSNWKNGCSFKVTFDEIKTKAENQKITKELVRSIILRAQ